MEIKTNAFVKVGTALTTLETVFLIADLMKFTLQLIRHALVLSALSTSEEFV